MRLKLGTKKDSKRKETESLAPTTITNFQLPREVYTGLDDIVKICEGCSRPLIITGERTYQKAGKRIEDLLENAETKKCYTNKVSESYVEKLAEETKKPSCIIAVGGGSKIDIGKLLAEKYGVDVFCVPTCASHDGVASNFASVYTNGEKTSKETIVPYGIIFDLDVIKDAPVRLNRAGWGDLIAKYSSVEDWYLMYKKEGKETAQFSRTVYDTLKKSAIETVNFFSSRHGQIDINNTLHHLVALLFQSAVCMNMTKTSVPCSGAEHKFAHIASKKSDALHGELVGLGTIYTSYLHGKSENARKVRNALEKIDLPTTAKEVRLTKQDIVDCLAQAVEFRPDRYTVLNKKFDDKSNKYINRKIKDRLKKLKII